MITQATTASTSILSTTSATIAASDEEPSVTSSFTSTIAAGKEEGKFLDGGLTFGVISSP